MSPTPAITARTRHCAMRYDRTHTHTHTHTHPHLYTPTHLCSLAAWSPNPFKLCPGFRLSQSTPRFILRCDDHGHPTHARFSGFPTSNQARSRSIVNHVDDFWFTFNSRTAASPINNPGVAAPGGSNAKFYKPAKSWEAPNHPGLSSALHYYDLRSESSLHENLHSSEIHVGRP